MTKRLQSRAALSLALSLGAGVGISADAVALSPQTNTAVTQVAFSGLDSYKVDDEATAYLGKDECEKAALDNPTFSARFTTTTDLTLNDANGSPLIQPAYAFSATDVGDRSPTCTDAESMCSELPSDDVVVSSTLVEITTSFSEITNITATSACEGLEEEYFIRMTFNSNTVTPTIQKVDARIVIDAVSPEPPASFTATATDAQIEVTWEDSPSGDVSAYQVVYSTSPFSGGVTPDEVDGDVKRANATDNSSNTNTVTASLTAGETVYVALAAVDEAGNVSVLLDPIEVTVVETVDFWDAYKAGGGAEEGGYCAAAPASPASPAPLGLGLAALGLLIGWRRRLTTGAAHE